MELPIKRKVAGLSITVTVEVNHLGVEILGVDTPSMLVEEALVFFGALSQDLSVVAEIARERFDEIQRENLEDAEGDDESPLGIGA